MRQCDFCARQIQDEAVYCRHCHRELGRNEALAGKKRCPFCAEWIERGTAVCPYCAKDLVPSGGLRPEPRPAQGAAEARTWDPRDLLRSGAGSEPPSAAAPVKRGWGPFGKARKEPGLPAPVPPFADTPQVEAESPSRGGRSLIRRLAAEPTGGRPESSTRPPLTGAGWIEEDRFGEGPLIPRAAPLEVKPVRAPEPAPAPSARPRRRRLLLLALLVLILVPLGVLAATRLPQIDLRGLLASFGRAVAAEPSATPTPPSPSATPRPSPTIAAVIEQTPTLTPGPGQDCRLWNQVSLADEGQTLCVYGEILRWYVTDVLPFVGVFSNEVGTFFVIDRTTAHEEIRPGYCVMVIGEVEVMSRTRPVIDAAGELMICQ